MSMDDKGLPKLWLEKDLKPRALVLTSQTTLQTNLGEMTLGRNTIIMIIGEGEEKVDEILP